MTGVSKHEWTPYQLTNLLEGMLHDPTAAGALLRIRPGAGWRSHTETIPEDDPATLLLGDERLRHLKKVQEYNEALRRFYERKFALKYLQGTRWIKEAEGAGWVMRTERGIAPTDKFGDSPVAEKMKELELEHIKICTRIGEANSPLDLAPHQKDIWRHIKSKGSYGWYFPYHRLFRQYRPSGISAATATATAPLAAAAAGTRSESPEYIERPHERPLDPVNGNKDDDRTTSAQAASEFDNAAGAISASTSASAPQPQRRVSASNPSTRDAAENVTIAERPRTLESSLGQSTLCSSSTKTHPIAQAGATAGPGPSTLANRLSRGTERHASSVSPAPGTGCKALTTADAELGTNNVLAHWTSSRGGASEGRAASNMGRSASDGAKTGKLAARISRPAEPVPLSNELASSDVSDDGRDMDRPPTLASRIGRVAAEDDVEMAVEAEAEVECVGRGAGSVIEVESDDDIIFDAERSYSTAPIALLRRPLSMRISSDPTPHAKRTHPVPSGPVDPEEMAEELDAILNPRRRAREERHRASLGSTPTLGMSRTGSAAEGSSRGVVRAEGGSCRQRKRRRTGGTTEYAYAGRSAGDSSDSLDGDYEGDTSASDDELITPSYGRNGTGRASGAIMPFDFGMLEEGHTPIAPGENILGFSFAPSNKTRSPSETADGSSTREPAVSLMMGDHPTSSVSPEVRCRGILIDDGTLDTGDEGMSGDEAMAGDDDAHVTIEEEEDWLPMSATPALRRSTAARCSLETQHVGHRRPIVGAADLLSGSTPRHDKHFDDTMEMNDDMEQDYISLDNGVNDNEDGSDDDWIMDLERTAGAGSLGTFMAALDEVSRSD